MSITVTIIEDQKEIREMLSSMISDSEGFSCLKTFENAEDAIAGIPELMPDVVLVDIHLPQESGIDCVLKLKPICPKTQFLMCTSFDDPKRTYDAITAGATGYLLKNVSPDKLREAIREIHSGGSPMSPEIARLVVAAFATKQKVNDLLSSFNAREQEILIMLSKGFQYKEIADKLSLSVETIRTYIRNIYGILQVHSRTDAVNKVFH